MTHLPEALGVFLFYIGGLMVGFVIGTHFPANPSALLQDSNTVIRGSCTFMGKDYGGGKWFVCTDNKNTK